MTERRVIQYVTELFENGLELYDSSLPKSSKGVVNPGGAKLFFHRDFRSNASRVVINHSGLSKVIHNIPVTVYTLNKIQLKDGKPVSVTSRTGRTGFMRTHTGLMLYCEFDKPEFVEDVKNKLIAAVPEVNFSDFVEIASNIPDPEHKLDVLKNLSHDDFKGDRVPLSLDQCIFIAVPSGAPNGSKFWTFRNDMVQSREAMSQAFTASPEETDDLPL